MRLFFRGRGFGPQKERKTETNSECYLPCGSPRRNATVISLIKCSLITDLLYEDYKNKSSLETPVVYLFLKTSVSNSSIRSGLFVPPVRCHSGLG